MLPRCENMAGGPEVLTSMGKSFKKNRQWTLSYMMGKRRSPSPTFSKGNSFGGEDLKQVLSYGAK